jgi:PST family polysaccharide transporter
MIPTPLGVSETGAKPGGADALRVSPANQMPSRAWLGMPRRLRSELAARPAAQNFAWLLADRGVRLAVGIVVGSWSARYFGAGNFGLLNYAMALVAIFGSVIPLGMDALVVREIIRDESAAGHWIGTVMGFRALTACGCAVLSVLAVLLLRPGEMPALAIVSVLAAGTIAQTLESGELLFEARIQMRRLVIPRLGLFFVMNALKIGLIIAGLSVFWFAVLFALEISFSGLLTYLFVRGGLGPQNPLRFDFARGWHLLRDSWPLAISGLVVIIYMKIGLIIIGSLLGNAAVGIYAAAIRAPEAANFIPMVLASSLLPGLLKTRELGAKVYNAALLRNFRIFALIAYAVCLPLSLGARWIIHLLFHDAYAASAPVMMVYVWSLVFAFLGVARGAYLLNERFTRLALFFSVTGLVVNLVCNWLLIPRLGVMGAAIATVLSYSISVLFSSFLIPSMRNVARLQCLALISPWMALRRDTDEKLQAQ